MLSANDDIEKLLFDAQLNAFLRRSGIQTIQDLIDIPPSELKELRGIGKKSLIKIEGKIERHMLRKLFGKKNLNLKDELAQILNDFIPILVKNVQNEFLSLNSQINEMRTLLLEQQRIIEGIQHYKEPEGALKQIDKKIPGFSQIVYELYKNLDLNK